MGSFFYAPVSGAQTPDVNAPQRFDVAAGITMNTPKDVNQRPRCTELALPCESPRTFPDFGFVLQIAAYPIAHVALVGEASAYVNRWDTAAVDPVDEPRYNHARALLAGPRLTTGQLHLGTTDSLGFRAFAQVLVGQEGSTILPARTAVQPGIGVDIRLRYPYLWVRATADYRSTHGGPRNLSTGRSMIALVMAN